MQRILLRHSLQDKYHCFQSIGARMYAARRVDGSICIERGHDAAMNRRRIKVLYSGGLGLERG